MKQSPNQRHDLEYFVEGILRGDRVVLGQAVTLVESQLASDQTLASLLLDKIIHTTGQSFRIGITGAPGVGKSTFIEIFGQHIIAQQKSLAVLTIDPSSQRTHGSILGDKTRMEGLSKHAMAFIRPSPASNMLGGVAERTREVMLLCEAAGYNIIIVETVGVGQSEIAVHGLVDFSLVLMLAGAGDELQGIKKGIIEVADAIVITKADGDNAPLAAAAQTTYQQALQSLPVGSSGWHPPALVSSALTKVGITEVWNVILSYQQSTTNSGYLQASRNLQKIGWFKDFFATLLRREVEQNATLKSIQMALEEEVIGQAIAPTFAAKKLLAAYHDLIRSKKV